MFKVPFTFLFDFEYVVPDARAAVMREMKLCGAEHLVLSDTLLKMLMREPSMAAMLKREMASAGLTFVDAHSPFGAELDLACPEPAMAERAIAMHKLAMAYCREFGVDTLTIHLGNDFEWPYPYPVDQCIDNCCRKLESLLPEAERLGVTICIENIFTANTMPEAMLAIKRRFPTDALGFCYDAGHANLNTSRARRMHPSSVILNFWARQKVMEPPVYDDILEQLLPEVCNCHLHDNNGGSDQHLAIGMGNVDWEHVVGLLKRAPRLKSVQCETIPCRNGLSIRDVIERFNALQAL